MSEMKAGQHISAMKLAENGTRHENLGMFTPILRSSGINKTEEQPVDVSFAMRVVDEAIASGLQHKEKVKKEEAQKKAAEAKGLEALDCSIIRSEGEARLEFVANQEVSRRGYIASKAASISSPPVLSPMDQNRRRLAEIQGIESAWSQAKTPEQAREIMNGQAQKQNGQTQ